MFKSRFTLFNVYHRTSEIKTKIPALLWKLNSKKLMFANPELKRRIAFIIVKRIWYSKLKTSVRYFCTWHSIIFLLLEEHVLHSFVFDVHCLLPVHSSHIFYTFEVQVLATASKPTDDCRLTNLPIWEPNYVKTSDKIANQILII